MNSIEDTLLTRDHRAKLLEICRDLFPEYKTISFGRKFFPDTEYLWFGDDMINECHWFELCITTLATKLYNLNNRSDISTIELYRGNIVQNYHPVDYLYKEYLFYKNE